MLILIFYLLKLVQTICVQIDLAYDLGSFKMWSLFLTSIIVINIGLYG